MSLKPKTAICVIAKNNERNIVRMLDSTKALFDIYSLVDTGSEDDTVRVFIEWCDKHDVDYVVDKNTEFLTVEVEGKEMLAEFHRARQISFDGAREAGAEYAIWIDTDDVMVNPEAAVDAVVQMKEQGHIMGMVTYNYAFTPDGKPAIVQKRERVIDLRAKGKWEGEVHEGYKFDIKDKSKLKGVVISKFWVDHLRSKDEGANTGRRNRLILKKVEKEKGFENLEAKQLWDIAYDHFERNEYSDAIKYFKRIEELEEKSEEKQMEQELYIKLSKCYLMDEQLDQSAAYLAKAKQIDVKHADIYLIQANLDSQFGDYESVVRNVNKCMEIGQPTGFDPRVSYDYNVRPLNLRYEAEMRLGRLDDAEGTVNQLIKLNPGNLINIEKIHKIRGVKRDKEYINALANISSYLENTNQMYLSKDLTKVVPEGLKKNKVVRQLVEEMEFDYSNKYRLAKIGETPSVDFYVGGHYKKWNGHSDNKEGIGGSEGMVIQMARELSKKGCKVRVYCETEGSTFDGVEYIPHNKWSADNEVDVFIASRSNGIEALKHLIKAKRIYLWLHDTQYGDVEPIRFYGCNRVLVLSEYHKSIIKSFHGLDDSILHVTRNAYNELAIPKESIERDIDTMIWASSYDRGLDFVLQNWEEIKRRLPEAKLKIFYGWDTFDALAKLRNDHNMNNFKEKMQELMEQEGIEHVGKVSQKELYKEFAKAGIWFYPTLFQEISCINAMTAQRLGCIPVVVPTGALQETVFSGIKASRNEIIDGLVYQFKNQDRFDRGKMQKEAEKRFNISDLADGWIKLFKSKELNK